MINYYEANEAVRGCIDELTHRYIQDMNKYPLSWIECAYDRALNVYVNEIDKRNRRIKNESE